MKQSSGENLARFYRKRKRRFVISAVCLTILIVILPVGVLNNTSGNMMAPQIVIRLDDVQDYAYRDAQLFLLNRSINDRIPLSLAVIAGKFGEDKGIVEAAKSAAAMGSEVASHGWEHENFTDFSPIEQTELLVKSKQKIREIFGVNTTAFIPPMYKFNGDTLTAMNESGFTLFSTFTHNAEPGWLLNTISLPGTVQLSDYQNEIWQVKSLELLNEEISASIKKYRFAVIVFHPQEFLTDGKLDPLKTAIYDELLQLIKKKYYFTTLTRLGVNLYPR